MRFQRVFAGLVSLLFLAAVAQASVVVLTFEGLKNLEPIGQYYNGGFGGSGSGPGPNYGIEFGSSALAVIDGDAGGSGNIANEPSPSTVAFFLSGPGVVMNVPLGFTTGFSFFYTSVSLAGTVTVWDGLNGTGNLLASLNLPALGSGCGGDPNGAFNCWSAMGVAFSGLARSVNFGGSANQIAFDNITLGSKDPGGEIPEPGSMGLLASGLVAVWMRRRAVQRSSSGN
jgi:hypothetical protein